ncbi:MAG: O-antigen ligase family protein [Bacteroidia bacterium]
MNQSVNRREAFQYFFPVFIAFLLPFGNALTSPLIGIWFIYSLIFGRFAYNKSGWKNSWLWILIGYFVLTLGSNYLNFNQDDPISSVEVKLSFLFFPILFFLFKINENVFKRIISGFISGVMFASLFCLGRGLFYWLQGDPSHLYYSKFSYFIHSAYFAMYLNLAVLLIALFYFKWFAGNKFYFRFSIALIIFFGLVIFLCASKIGIALFFLLTLLFIIIHYRKQIAVKYYVIGFASLFAMCLLVYFTLPEVFERLKSVSVVTKDSINKESTESSSVRVLIWEECWEIIKENPITGVGVSQVNPILYKSYEEHGITGAFDKKLNAHNQFFQTWIGLGILGLGLLLMQTFGLAAFGWMKRNKVLIYFGLLCGINFLVESMLQTAAGTVFFVYFLCLFIVYDESKYS